MDWNGLLNQLMPTLITLLTTIITALAGYIATSIKNAYTKKVNTETAKTVVNDVVKFVQQVYADLNGPEKLQKAIQQASLILQEKGIKITETEINMLIESAVYGIKQSMTAEQLALKEAQDKVEVVVDENAHTKKK